jgi:hypothetical protein
MHRLVVPLLAAALSACGGSQPSVTPTPTAVSTPAPDAATVVRLVQENIAELYATAPQPPWYRWLHLVKGKPDVSYEDGWITVGAVLSQSQKAIADSMCHDLAIAAYDANGDPIGFHDVMIVNAKDVLTDCDVPER